MDPQTPSTVSSNYTRKRHSRPERQSLQHHHLGHGSHLSQSVDLSQLQRREGKVPVRTNSVTYGSTNVNKPVRGAVTMHGIPV